MPIITYLKEWNKDLTLLKAAVWVLCFFMLFALLQKQLFELSFTHIEVGEVYADYIAGLVFALFLTFLLVLLPLREKRIVLLSWLVKLGVVFLVGLFYENHYQLLDAFMYHQVAIQHPSHHFGISQGTQNVSILLSYLYSLTYSSYRLGVVFFSFMSLLGLYIFWLALPRQKHHVDKYFLLLLLLFPSLLFWGHIIGKESLTLFLFGIYFYGYTALFFRHNMRLGISLIALAMVGFLYVRFWYIPILSLALMLSLFFINYRFFYNKILLLLCSGAVLALGIGLLYKFFSFLGLPDILSYINYFTHLWAGGSELESLQFYSITQYVLHFPQLVFTSLFYPFFFNANNAFQLLASAENAILFILCILAVRRIMSKKIEYKDIIKVSVIHVFAWVLFYAPISAQNMGAGMRFRSAILPFILLFIFYSLMYKKNNVVCRNSI